MAIESTEREKQKQLDREIRDMVSALTSRLSNIQQKPGGGSGGDSGNDDDEHGVRIITIAGNNVGATLRSEADEKSGVEGEELETLGTLVNSNFQAVNNSIMMGGNYSSNDPGVHMDVSEYLMSERLTNPHNKLGRKGKKKEKEERATEHSST